MLKKLVQRPEWLKAVGVADIYSVSGCISENFTDYVQYWRHNGYWMFDSPGLMEDIARKNKIDLNRMTLFYYEVFESEFDVHTKTWSIFDRDLPLPTNVEPPKSSRLMGYDVVTFSVGTSPECSPLSCNGLAEEIPTTPHCLFDTLERAKQSLEDGRFDQSEPGPFRIFAVYRPGS